MSASVNNYLSALRNQNSYSMKDVYEKTGITNSRLSRIEKGEISPAFSDLIVLLKLYNTDILDFLVNVGLISSSYGFKNTSSLDSEEIKHVQREINFLVKHKTRS